MRLIRPGRAHFPQLGLILRTRRPRRRRRCFGTKMPVSVSTKVRPSSTMRPRSGRTSPAIRLMVVDLREPDRPNRAVTPSSFSNSISRSNAPSFRAASTDHARPAMRRPSPSIVAGYESAEKRNFRSQERHRIIDDRAELRLVIARQFRAEKPLIRVIEMHLQSFERPA